MKKFVFSLQKVLSVKEQLLEVKKNEMLTIENKIKDLENQEIRVRQEFKEYNEKLNSELQTGTTPDKVMTYKIYAKSLIYKENQLVEQKKYHLRLKAQKQEELIDVKAEISGLEKLEEKQINEYNTSLRKEQERNIEEYVNQKSAAQNSASDI